MAILSQNNSEYIEVMGGAHLAGLILVTLNWRLAVPEFLAILKDCDPAVLVFESQYTGTVAALRAEALRRVSSASGSLRTGRSPTKTPSP